MKYMKPGRQRQILLGGVITLSLANLIVWGEKVFAGFPTGSLYSSGTAISAIGSEFNYSDKLEFKDEHYNFALRINWDGKTNIMQESGLASHDLWGAININVTHSSSFGPPALSEINLGDDLLFGRSYMQGGHGTIRLIPFTGDFSGICYYFYYMKKVYCGANQLR